MPKECDICRSRAYHRSLHYHQWDTTINLLMSCSNRYTFVFRSNQRHILCNFTKGSERYPSHKLIIGGDFNATIGTDCESEKWTCVGNNNDPDSTSSNGTRLLAFAEEQNLSIMNSKFGYKNIHKW